MKNVLKKLFGQKGFSLPEVMLAVGLMGGMSLLVTHVVKQTDQAKKSTETSTNTFAAFYEIQSLFSKKDVCAQNLIGKKANDPLTVLIDEKSRVRFETGKTYEAGSIRLNSMVLTRNGGETLINVAIQKVGNKKANGLMDTVVTKSIPVNAEYDGAGNVISCQADVTNHMTTAVDNATAKICSGQNMIYDAATKRCSTAQQMGALAICTTGHSLVATRFDSGTSKYSYTCEDSTKLMAAGCNGNQLVRRNGQTISCVDVNCPANRIFQGLDVNGSVQCASCGPGETLVFVGGALSCKSLNCGTGKYMVGLDSNANPICNTLVDTSKAACANGKLAVNANGELYFDCCTIDCSNAATQCTGTTYTSVNNCGQCTGTQPVSCPTANNYCQGTSYPGTCGLCQGTRLPTNASWSAWSACTNGTRTRTCDNAQTCGGAACSGPSSEACGSTTWQCQHANIQLIPGYTNYWYAYNVRMEPMDWQQIRPNWPVVKTPGNSWQQGNHQGCVNQCANAAEVRYASSIVMDNGKPVTSDQNMAISIGVTDIFFQANSNYNTGTPNGTNDNSGWWCACYTKLHAKTATLAFLDHQIQKSPVDSQREDATFCTMNGTLPAGGTPAPGPTPVVRTNGGWSAWGAWQGCSNNVQYRTRSCTNPAPDAGGLDCVGPSSESQACVSVDTCLPATCSSGSKYFYQNSQDFMKVCQMSGASCVSTSAGSTCTHKGKSPYSMCSQTYPGSAGGLSSCTYQGLTYWTSTGCTW